VRELWLRELRNLASTSHPHLLHVFDAFEISATPFTSSLSVVLSVWRNLLHWGMSQREAWPKTVAEGLLQAIDFIHSAGRPPPTHPGSIYTRHVDGERRGPESRAISFKAGRTGDEPGCNLTIACSARLIKPWIVPPEFLNPGGIW